MKFISKGYVFLPHLSMGISPGQDIWLFPFLRVKVNNWYGVGSPPTTFIKCYEAKLYSEIPDANLEQTQDTGNRTQTEPHIRLTLELYLLAHSIFYGEALQFQFINTLPESADAPIPPQATPLAVNIEPGDLQRLYPGQEFIEDGQVSNATTQGPLSENQDLGYQRFTLVKPMGTGGLMLGQVEPGNQSLVSGILEDTVQKIRGNSANQSVIKALDFLRRALVLEKSGFYNEAYLNFFRIVEAFCGGYSERDVVQFLTVTTELSEGQARNLCRVRSRVVAHGNQPLPFFREVGQTEFYRIKEVALLIIEASLM